MSPMKRREAVGTLLGAGAVLLRKEPQPPVLPSSRPPGRLKQSVSYWPYSKIPLAAFARECRKLGLAAIDLLQPEQWPVVRDAGLVCSMGYPTNRGDFLTSGVNDPAQRSLRLDEPERTLPLAAAAGVPNLIAMFGNRKGLGEAAGVEHCIAGLSRVKASAERHGVTLCVEPLNSQGGHTAHKR